MNYETALLKTKRLIMRRGEKEDFLKVYEYDFSKLKNVDGICKLVKQDPKKIENLFKGGMKRYYSKIKKAHMFDWIIYLDDIAIGNVLTEEENYDERKIELSCNLHPSYWGNGYMPEAISCVIEYLFYLGYDNIICTYQDGNIKAKRVLDKLGFKPYRIIEDAWKAQSGNMIDDYKVIMTKDCWFSRTGKLSKIQDSL